MRRSIVSAIGTVAAMLVLVPAALAHSGHGQPPPSEKPPCRPVLPPTPPAPPAPPCNCPPGEQGPKGDQGPPGVTTVVTIVVQQPPETCTSHRKYAFRVRKTYGGHKVVGVLAFEKGQHPVVRKNGEGRRVISWSTDGQVFPKGGVLKVMGAIAKLDNGKYVRLRYFYRPCAAKDGNPNDDSAVATPVSSKPKTLKNAENAVVPA